MYADTCTRVATLVEPSQSVLFLNTIAEKISVVNPAAYSLALTESAAYSLVLGDVETVSSVLEKSRDLIEGLAGLDYQIHASQYCLAAALDKSTSSYNSYYKNALLYLGIVPLADLTKEETLSWAHDISIAALLGDKIYNFGELFLSDILMALSGSPFEWLRGLLEAFHTGNMALFESVTASHAKDASCHLFPHCTSLSQCCFPIFFPFSLSLLPTVVFCDKSNVLLVW